MERLKFFTFFWWTQQGFFYWGMGEIPPPLDKKLLISSTPGKVPPVDSPHQRFSPPLNDNFHVISQ